MKYILLIYQSEMEWDAMSEERQQAEMGESLRFTDDIRRTGNHVSDATLAPTSTATTVRLRSGRTTLTDGPFAGTVRQLGGFYIVEVGNADDAIALGDRLLGARWGLVEVRPFN